MSFEGMQLDHYRLLRLIGRGGMSEVYLAEDTRIERQVAIKVLLTDATSHPNQEAERLFRREMQAIIRLDHPHILHLHDFGEQRISDTTLTYMVMPFRPEGSLSEWLRRRDNTPLPPTEAARLIQQAADALQHAHDRQIIHQDVKPSNFLIRTRSAHPDQPDLLLADFGIAKFAEATTMTSDHMRGTPTYMAPEQWNGHPVPASDQYSLAIMAYQLLTGHPPFSGRMELLMHQHLMVQPQPPSRLNPQISPALDDVILRALAKKPEERFLSISAFAHAFQQALQHTGELRVTLAISQDEALHGTTRLLTLPDGRAIPVPVPRGAHSGQILRLGEQGEVLSAGIPGASLLVTLLVAQQEKPPALPSNTTMDEKTALAVSSMDIHIPPPPPIVDRRVIVSQRQQNTRRRFILLATIGLVILIVLVSAITLGSITYQNSINAANATATAHAQTATATSIANPYPPHIGTLVLDDPLTQAATSMWQVDSTPSSNGSICHFTNGAYHIQVTQTNYFYYCADPSSSFSNFTFEVQMTILKGDCGGIIFRAHPNGQFYFFRVCQDQSYRLTLYVDFTGAHTKRLTNNQHTAIHPGFNQSNTLAVVANNDTLDLYANHVLLSSISDNTYNNGEIGMFAQTINNPTEVIYTHARIWTI